MKDNAVLQRRFWHRGGLLVAVPLTAVALLLAGLLGSATAAKVVGKDGKVYACYAVKAKKGKPKGSVRLVSKGMHCKRGERKVNWSVTGPAGAPGVAGANGASGAQGAAGGAGTTTLETKVSELTTRVESLEATLANVSNAALLGVIDDVDQLCEQTSEITDQSNEILGALEDTVLDGVIPLGLELLVPGLPTQALPSFDC